MLSAIATAVSLVMAIMLLIFAIVQKWRLKKIANKKELALKSVAVGICERLYASYPGSRWRWVCRATGFAVNGGIARIEVVHSSGKQQFIDICLSTNGYMALHVANVVELTVSDTIPTTAGYKNSVSATETAMPTAASKPLDEESIGMWYNIVLINALTDLIDDLNAKGEVCLYIGQDGKAYVDENGHAIVIYEFGEMPGMALWGHITEKLGTAGLFAEVQEENCIFISWV